MFRETNNVLLLPPCCRQRDCMLFLVFSIISSYGCFEGKNVPPSHQQQQQKTTLQWGTHTPSSGAIYTAAGYPPFFLPGVPLHLPRYNSRPLQPTKHSTFLSHAAVRQCDWGKERKRSCYKGKVGGEENAPPLLFWIRSLAPPPLVGVLPDKYSPTPMPRGTRCWQ